MEGCKIPKVFRNYQEAIGKDKISIAVVDECDPLTFVGSEDVVLLRTASKMLIDTIRSKYLAQLRSSKKVVVTLCGTSNPSGLLEKLADCLDGLNVVWQTRTLPAQESLEISIVIL